MSRVLFWIITALLVIGGGYFAYHYWQNETLPEFSAGSIENLSGSVAGDSIDLGEISQNAGSQFSTFTERAAKVGTHTRDFFSTAIQPNVADPTGSDSAKPLHESAMEYGQYMYCKQVVDSYEALQEKNQ